MAFTTENRHRTNSSQGSSINGSFLFRLPHGPINVRPSFPTPTDIGTVGTYFKEVDCVGLFKLENVFSCTSDGQAGFDGVE